MSFLSDLGSFLSDAQQVNDELNAVKDDVIGNAKDTFMQMGTQAQGVAADLQSSASSVAQTTKDAADDVKSQLTNN